MDYLLIYECDELFVYHIENPSDEMVTILEKVDGAYGNTCDCTDEQLVALERLSELVMELDLGARLVKTKQIGTAIVVQCGWAL